MFGQDRAKLDELRIVTRTWGSGEAAEYQADLLAPVPGVAGNWAPIVRLNECEPEEIRAFARALLEVAGETEHQYDTDRDLDDEPEVTTEDLGQAVEQLEEAEAAVERVRFLAEHGSVELTRGRRWVAVDDLLGALDGGA